MTTDLHTLIADLESAQEGSRELSDRVLLANGWAYKVKNGWWHHPSRDNNKMVRAKDRPDPTRSVDHAIREVPEMYRYLLDKRRYAGDRRYSYRAHVWYGAKPRYEETESWASTDPLALSAAICRARMAMEE